jgi:hypothetical protein
MREQQEQYTQSQSPTPEPEKKSTRANKSDYIDFEEIKD